MQRQWYLTSLCHSTLWGLGLACTLHSRYTSSPLLTSDTDREEPSDNLALDMSKKKIISFNNLNVKYLQWIFRFWIVSTPELGKLGTSALHLILFPESSGEARRDIVLVVMLLLFPLVWNIIFIMGELIFLVVEMDGCTSMILEAHKIIKKECNYGIQKK